MPKEKEYVYLPVGDFLVERVDRTTAYEMPSFHLHYKYEIYYEIEGTRRYVIEDSAYIVHAGSVVLIGENQIHKTGAIGDGPSSRIVVNFSAAYLAELTRSFPGVDFCGFLNEKENHLLHTLTPRQQNYVYALLRQLLALADDTGRQVCAAKKLLLGTLLLYLQKQCRLQRELGCGSGRVTNCLVDQVQGYVVQHYAEKLTLPQIAARFYISPCYLSRLFKRTINLSLVEYINGVRVKAAQRQLEKTRRSISEVAADTGFSTVAHFRRVFKEATGLSPQQYRQYSLRQTREDADEGE